MKCVCVCETNNGLSRTCLQLIHGLRIGYMPQPLHEAYLGFCPGDSPDTTWPLHVANASVFGWPFIYARYARKGSVHNLYMIFLLPCIILQLVSGLCYASMPRLYGVKPILGLPWDRLQTMQPWACSQCTGLWLAFQCCIPFAGTSQ